MLRWFVCHYSRQPRLGLATYSLFVSLVCLSFFLFVRAARGSSQIVSVGLDVCCPSLFSKTALPTFMKLYIMLSYVSVWKPIKFGVNWSMLIKLIAKKNMILPIVSFHVLYFTLDKCGVTVDTCTLVKVQLNQTS